MTRSVEGVDVLLFLVFGGTLLLVGAYFAVDWWLSGRATQRSLPRVRESRAP